MNVNDVIFIVGTLLAMPLCGLIAWVVSKIIAHAENRRNEVEELRDMPRWIPVTEALPNDIYPVNIVWVNREPEAYYSDIKNKPFTATGVYFAGHWYWYSATIEDILNEYGDIPHLRVDSAIEITHWAEIPEPPEEETTWEETT